MGNFVAKRNDSPALKLPKAAEAPIVCISYAGIESCDALLRLVNELQRADNMATPDTDAPSSLDATCKHLLNDYIHLVTNHQEDMESIRQELTTMEVIPRDTHLIWRHTQRPSLH